MLYRESIFITGFPGFIAGRLVARLAKDFPREHEPCPIGSDRALDAGRHPGEILSFFGIKPGMKVAELVADLGLDDNLTKPLKKAEANFKDTADGETGHAHGHLDYLKQVGDPATGLPIGNTEKNLKSSVAGETHEYETMYPGMAKQAREEGFEDIADWFETLAKAEKSHAGRFQKALEALDF